jgi:aryl-alcohol dehydrogenase-like predicted oxidoreductase
MYTRKLGRTGLRVSALALGTMQFGWSADEPMSFAVLDAYTAAGGCLIDTADIYSNWVEGHTGGESEMIIGRWMRKRGNRHELILATKGRGRMWLGPNGEGLSRAHLVRAVDDSLRRLQTDYIDLYQTHYFDGETPIEETLGVLTDLVRAGKLRYVGCSNLPAWRLVESLWAADRHGLVRYASLQPHYNLAHRAEFETDLREVCERYGLGVLPYSPLAGGFLTGKYRSGGAEAQKSVRAARIRQRYDSSDGRALIERLVQAAEHVDATPGQVALAWLLAQPTVTAPIIGANHPAQLAESLAALDLQLDAEILATL